MMIEPDLRLRQSVESVLVHGLLTHLTNQGLHVTVLANGNVLYHSEKEGQKGGGGNPPERAPTLALSVKLSALWHGFFGALWHPEGVSTARRAGSVSRIPGERSTPRL